MEIEVGRVKQVLLWHWHEVIPGTFTLQEYDYVGHGGAHDEAGVTWQERNETGQERQIFCPLAAIKAVSYGWESK